MPQTFLEWREVIYAKLRDAVDAAYPKQGDFADAVGASNGDVSLRLKHGDNAQGLPQRAFIDYLAALAIVPGGYERFIIDTGREKGLKCEPAAPPSDQETWRALAADMTDKRKRQVERERGWPEGWLDR